jgi:hypothetical protein
MYTNLMIPRLRLRQFSGENGRPGVGWTAPDGEGVGGVGVFEFL